MANFLKIFNMIDTIIFDADDTLWHNEPYFRGNEEKYFALMSRFGSRDQMQRALFEKEMGDLPLYGYGIKAFVLSMLELYVSKTGKDDPKVYDDVKSILELGRTQLNEPVNLLEGVEDVLKALYGRFRLVIATKGDLLDQERKLRRSGIEHYFHHIEVMSEKRTEDYVEVLDRLGLDASEVMMVGNSVKSDVVPMIELGGWGVHVPYETTWEHERYDGEIKSDKFFELTSIGGLLVLIDNLTS